MKNPRGKRTVPDLIARFNFLFSNCLDEEILHCHTCEFNRELKQYHLPWLIWREKAAAQTFDAFFEYLGGKSWFLSANIPGPQFPFYLFPEWPDYPYLSIDPAERRRRWQVLYRQSKLRSLFALPVHYLAVQDCASKLRRGKLPIVRSRYDLIVPVALPIAESKEAWLRRLHEFASHLDHVRGRLCPSMKAQIDKKRSPFVQKMKAELKALGALRLIEGSGGFREDGGVSGSVIEAASAICTDAGVDPLFLSHRRWSVAGRLALQVLDDYKFNLRSQGVIRSN
jgi:hypothetical protein